MSSRKDRIYFVCDHTLEIYRPCPDGLASQKFINPQLFKSHIRTSSSLAASGAPFMLCKNYSTCGSGVQPTAPGNDIHSVYFHSVVYSIPTQVTIEFGCYSYRPQTFHQKIFHSNFVPQ